MTAVTSGLVFLFLFTQIAMPETVDELMDLLPDQIEGYYSDDPLVEFDEADSSYVSRVSKLYYTIHGESVQLEWTNHNANPNHFDEEVGQLPSFDLPGFFPDALAEMPVGVAREENEVVYGFYFEDRRIVFSMTVTADEDEEQEELARAVIDRIDTNGLMAWEGF